MAQVAVWLGPSLGWMPPLCHAPLAARSAGLCRAGSLYMTVCGCGGVRSGGCLGNPLAMAGRPTVPVVPVAAARWGPGWPWHAGWARLGPARSTGVESGSGA